MTGAPPSELPDVTVVIPAYNLAPYLADAVNSVLQQSYRGGLRIVILDDGSTDNTLAVARSIAASRPQIEVHNQTNQGRARTRNRLIDLARTELIAWLDADDLASPLWIEQQVDYLQDHPDCAAVSGQGYSMTATGRAIGPMDHPLDGDEIDRRHISGEANAFFQSCVTVRKTAVIRAGRYDEKYPCAEDYSLWLRLAEVGRLANLPAVHLYYRVHSTSANWTVNVDQRLQGQSIMNEARQRRGLPTLAVTAHEIPPAKKDDWNRRLYWINIALRSGNPRSALEMLRVALRKHPCSLVMWLAAMVAIGDTILLAGNRTAKFSSGNPPQIGSLPRISCYRFCRNANRIRRRIFSMTASNP
jgi:GT2 family glycosyltransferase